jgi:hypothetical protein
VGGGNSKYCRAGNFCFSEGDAIPGGAILAFDCISLRIRCFSTRITSTFHSAEKVLLLQNCIDNFQILNIR